MKLDLFRLENTDWIANKIAVVPMPTGVMRKRENASVKAGGSVSKFAFSF